MDRPVNKHQATQAPVTLKEALAAQIPIWLSELSRDGLDRSYPVNPLSVRARISSGYGRRNTEGIEMTGNHEAIDLVPADKINGPVHVHAAAAGRVLYVGKPDGHSGQTVVIGGVNGKLYSYAHLANDSFKVSVGQHVGRGQILADMGSTGTTNGAPCLHFVERMITMTGRAARTNDPDYNFNDWLYAARDKQHTYNVSASHFRELLGALAKPPTALEDFSRNPPRIFFDLDPHKAEFVRANEPRDLVSHRYDKTSPKPAQTPPVPHEESSWSFTGFMGRIAAYIGSWGTWFFSSSASAAEVRQPNYHVTIPVPPPKHLPPSGGHGLPDTHRSQVPQQR